MKLLVDTHALLWAVDQPGELGATARAHLEDRGNDLVVSMATVWELAIKVSLGKLRLAHPFESWVTAALQHLSAELLDIRIPHAVAQTTLPWHHRDPFDRLLIAQSRVEELPLVSNDRQLDQYGIERVW